MALASGECRVQESIRRQSTPGEPVVPAFPTREMCRQWLLLETGNASDPGRDRCRTKIVGTQAAAPVTQRVNRLSAAVAYR
jgi:hypothetical protein